MIISKTPFRISFVGGGTDIDTFYKDHNGAVVSAAINKYMYIAVNKKFDGKIRVSYSSTEIVNSVDELQHDIIRAALEMTGITDGIEIVSVSDIPKGTGLGSSSAFTVGLLNALYLYQGNQLSNTELAEKACEIEIDILKSPIGKQDQYAAACGGVNMFEFCSDGSVSRTPIQFQHDDFMKANRRLMMFYTGNERSANSILAQQKKDMPSKVQTLCAMRDQAYSLNEELIRNGFTEQFGVALKSAWEMKRTISGGISNLRIDELHKAAMDAGAVGGKLLGAGGSGFLLFYVDENKQDAVREAVGLPELDFRFSKYGTRIICSD